MFRTCGSQAASAIRKAASVILKPPARPKYYIQQPHEVVPGDELEVDWTLHKVTAEEYRLREIRNKLIRK